MKDTTRRMRPACLNAQDKKGKPALKNLVHTCVVVRSTYPSGILISSNFSVDGIKRQRVKYEKTSDTMGQSSVVFDEIYHL